MGYSFDRSDRDVATGLRRIAREQIASGLEEIADPDLSVAERVHQVRKRCKKLRGLVRLVRPVFDDYAAENAAFRATARRLSDLRDAAALVETCDAITDRFGDRLDAAAFADLRAALVEEARERERAADVGDRFERTRTDLCAARDRVARWTLKGDGPEAVVSGAEKTFGRARDAMAAARKEPSGEMLHEWRKRVKYHWYHMRLLKRTAPMVSAQADVADALADDLGDHHDTHVMAAALDRMAERIPDTGVEALRGLLLARRESLEARTFAVGEMLFSEKPGGQSRRLAGYWRAWRDTGA